MAYTVEVLRPKEFSPELCREVQGVSREAEMWRQLQLPDKYRRSPEEVDHFVRWDDPEGYRQSFIDPNRDVGGRIRSKNKFWDPKLVVARDLGSSAVIGSLFSAQNVSGPLLRQFIKRHGPSPSKLYLWISMIAVLPEHQHRGVAKDMLSSLLETANPNQPVAAYPDALNGTVIDWLSRLSFVETGRSAVDRYGTGAQDVTQIRMQADRVSSVLHRLS